MEATTATNGSRLSPSTVFCSRPPPSSGREQDAAFQPQLSPQAAVVTRSCAARGLRHCPSQVRSRIKPDQAGLACTRLNANRATARRRELTAHRRCRIISALFGSRTLSIGAFRIAILKRERFRIISDRHLAAKTAPNFRLGVTCSAN